MPNSIDLIITEPPFRTVHRRAVMDAIPELYRALKPKGRMVFLISSDMCEEVCTSFERLGEKVNFVGVISRGGGLRCPVLEVGPIRIEREEIVFKTPIVSRGMSP